MRVQLVLAAAAAACTLVTMPASAQPYGQTQDRRGDGYYSQTDRNGYYDRDGSYQRFGGPYDPHGGNPDARDSRGEYTRAQPGAYYQQGTYEQNCRRGSNEAAGTIFGALAGGLIGGAASHGNGGAVVGGAVLGGLLGNVVSKDIDCDDQPAAFQVYSNGLNGDLGRRYDWNHGQGRGHFTPTREFRRGAVVCRDFTETTYRGSRQFTRSGSACRAQDGNWHFD